MLPLRWSAKALDELDAIAAYIALFNPAAAEQLQAPASWRLGTSMTAGQSDPSAVPPG